MAVAVGVSFWISNVISRCEQNAYLGQKTDIENLLKGAAFGKISKVE